MSQLFETSQHRFWVATTKGLVEYLPAGDAQGRHFLTYGARNGLTYDGIDALGEDLGGSLWLGMSDEGVMKLANSGLTAYGDAMVYTRSVPSSRIAPTNCVSVAACSATRGGACSKAPDSTW